MAKRRKKLQPGAEEQQIVADREENNAVQRQRTRAHQAAFLAAFCESGVVTYAARDANVDRTNVYGWLDRDPEFAEAYAEATKVAHEKLVHEARRRAVDGYDEYVTTGKGLVMDPADESKPLLQRRFSDALLKFLIERHEGKLAQSLHVTGSVDQHIEITKKEVTIHLAADVTRLLVEEGLGRNDPEGGRDAAGDQGQPLDSALALAKASRLPKPPT